METNWELGSNYSVGIGGVSGIAELTANVDRLIKNLSGPIRREALWAGAQVIKSAIEAHTPVGSQYTYKNQQGKSYVVKDKHPGRAKAHVIIYQRKAKTHADKTYALAPLSQESYVEGEGAEALLVGYEKDPAFYMYFVEKGYTARKAGDIVVRTRAGGKSVTKHFTAEDLYFQAVRSRRGWTKQAFGREIAKREASGGHKISAKPFMEDAMNSAAENAIRAIEQKIQSFFAGVA